MPKCPNCGRKIDELETAVEEVRVYRVRLSEDGEVEWKSIDVEDSEDSNVFCCPKCGEPIIFGYENAITFLKSITP